MAIPPLVFTSPLVPIGLAGVLGLFIGSFLNVVIHRLPLMMERDVRSAETGSNSSAADEPSFNLAVPPSACPACGHRIRPWENIPVLSYLILRGRCGGCGGKISLRYPLVELLTATLFVMAVHRFGWSVESVWAMTLAGFLVCLAAIDLDRRLLPDELTLPLLWLGLLGSLWMGFASPPQAIAGAAIGYSSLWSIYWAHRLLAGRDGMGYGDFKLFAALGAWGGWHNLPLVALTAALFGIVLGTASVALAGRHRRTPLPFGPFLAGGGWIAVLWGDFITALLFGRT